MNKDLYTQTVKTIRSEKPQQSHALVTFHWDFRNLILPYGKGLELMAAIEGAMAYKDRYSESPELRPLTHGDIELKPMPQSDVEDIKVAQLLAISLKEVQENKAKPAASTTS